MALRKKAGTVARGICFCSICLTFAFCAVFVRHAFGAESGRGIVPVRVKKADGSYAKKQLYESSHALLIGVSDYTAGWDDLESIPAEMAKVEALLRSQGFSVEKRMNPDARGLKSAFEDFIGKYGYNIKARLLFFFSGHGFTRLDGTKGYLVPSDAPNPFKDEKGFLRKALPMSQILAWSKQIEAKHALFLFDSCFSGTVFKAKALPEAPPAITEMALKPVRQFITAGGADDEVPAKSVFTPAFVDALQYGKGDMNKDGYVSGTELGLHLKDVVSRYVRQFPQYGKIRDYDLAQGDFVFSLAGGGSATTLSVESTVKGAGVYLDGKYVGATDLSDKTVSPGRHKVSVRKPGYQTYEKDLEIDEGNSESLFVVLNEDKPVAQVPKTGRLYVDTDPADALVRILNIGPRFRDGIELDPGPYQLEISASGYETRTFWIELSAGEKKRIDIALNPTGGGNVQSVGGKFRNDLGMEFVYIPPGSFTMGSPSDEKGRGGDETQHRVTLTRGFYMQTTEVTQGQWEAVMGRNPSHFKKCGSNCPVENVSWNDVQEFIRKLNVLNGNSEYRLPTEAEWEYAARAGTVTPFSFGNCLSADQANYDGNYPMPGCPKGKYRETTMRVASFSPNDWGLYDMHGNVWEWCQDWYGAYDQNDVVDPKGPEKGAYRVLRGGSWSYFARICRSAYRGRYDPSDCISCVGFRLAAPPGR